MKCLILLSLFLFASCEIKEEDDVQVGTDENFDEIVTVENDVLVEFYAPWCGHCKSLEPEYAKAAATLKADGSPVKLCKVDATIATKLAEKFGVQGFPTLKFFKKGQATEYGGGRTEKEIVSWIKKKTGPPAESLGDTEAVKKFTDGRDVAVVGFFADKESALAKAFLKAADGIDDVECGIAVPASSGELAITEDKIVIVRNLTTNELTTLEKLMPKQSLNLSRENQSLLSQSSLTKLHQRSSVVISNLTFFCSSARNLMTSQKPLKPSLNLPKDSKEKFCSSTLILMLRIMAVSWNSSDLRLLMHQPLD